MPRLPHAESSGPPPEEAPHPVQVARIAHLPDKASQPLFCLDARDLGLAAAEVNATQAANEAVHSRQLLAAGHVARA